MIKKVPVSALRLGMFIHDLNSGWMAHSFWRSRFMLRKEEDLVKILNSGITEVLIDTVKGLDADGIAESEAQRHLTERMVEAVIHHPEPQPRQFREEVAVAQKIQQEANTVVASMLDDVRMGRQMQVEKMEPVVERVTDSILRNQGALLSLNRIKQADTYTFQHCVSVCTLMVAFCRFMGMDHETIQLAGMGGMMHDLGKMQIPDSVLNKPGKLTDEEFDVMKSHVVLGVEILRQTPGLPAGVFEIAGQHHERFGGKGYPHGLEGQEISLLGRMASIVDVYDAITSNRVYHQGMEPALALQKLFEWSEFHFDPDLVQHFIQAVGIYPTGSLLRLESGRLAVVVDQSPKDLLHPTVRVVYDTKRRLALPPKDLELSSATNQDAIVGYEDPTHWDIQPLSYLTLDIGL